MTRAYALRIGVVLVVIPRIAGILTWPSPDRLGPGVPELALNHRGGAFRFVYALQVDAEIRVIQTACFRY